MDVVNDFPRLAVGPHLAGSGKGCIMNVISHWNGDKQITDMPSCTHPVLAKIAQILNDTICTHRTGDLLCVDCSTIMFGYEPLLVGTLEPTNQFQAKRLSVTMAVSMRPIVEPLWRPEDREFCSADFDAAQRWLDENIFSYVNSRNVYIPNDVVAHHSAAAAAYTAYTAGAPYTANTLYATAAAASAASATSYAASAAVYAKANGGPTVQDVLDLLINVYYEFMKKSKPNISEEHWMKVRNVCELAGIK